METKSIGFIGGGRITRILLEAFQKENLKFKRIVVCDPNKDTIATIGEKFPEAHCNSHSCETEATCDIIVLAVHAPQIPEILEKIKDFLKKDALLISLAPKISIAKMSKMLNGFANIMRLIPSATAIIQEGIHPYTFSSTINKEGKKNSMKVLNSLGKIIEVKEQKLEAYAITAAMGSTYFWFQWQKLFELATEFGMNEIEAKEALSHMIHSSANTLLNSDLTPEHVMDLIPVKPIGEHEEEIKNIYEKKLKGLFDKINTLG